MQSVDAIKALCGLDRDGRAVFSAAELRCIFPELSRHTFTDGLRRLVAQGILKRAAHGVYVNALSRGPRAWRDEEAAIRLRSGEYSYVSLESALSAFGVISQIPVGRTTMMTTGRSGEIHSIYGTLDFTHTARPARDILASTMMIEGRPMRFARVETALRNLRRVGRNMDLVDMDVYREILEEQAAAGGSAG